MKKIILLLLTLVNIIFPSCTDVETYNKNKGLETFTRLYGLVKYFHPSDEATKIDWDRFAIYGTEQVLTVRSNDELKTVLQELFRPIAPSMNLAEVDTRWDKISSFESLDSAILDTVFWQHQGLGFSRSNHYAYKSARVGRPAHIAPIYGTGKFSFNIDAKDLAGKQVKLEMQLKGDAKNTSTYGMVSYYSKGINGSYKKHGDLVTHNQSHDWSSYTVVDSLPKNLAEIRVDLTSRGLGKMWFDSFKIYTLDNDSIYYHTCPNNFQVTPEIGQ